MKVYRCAIDAEQAKSPVEWAALFQRRACKTLRAPDRTPLPRIADRILQLRPGADRQQLRRLLQELDNALYNGGHLEMKRWKRDFRRALRPGLGGMKGLLEHRAREPRLPDLNPRASDTR